MITIKVLLFSVLKEKIGQPNVLVQLESPLTGEQLLDQLALDYLPIQAYRSVIRLAVNEAYVNETHNILDGDEVALITPVSGG